MIATSPNDESFGSHDWLEVIHQRRVSTLDAIRDAIFVAEADCRTYRVCSPRNSNATHRAYRAALGMDAAFAVRVIALANSSASAPVSPVTTIRDAIARMGVATISRLVASLAVQKVFMPTEPGQIRLWTHSIFVASAAEQIAKLTPKLKVDSGEAYLSGLLHDIGRFVMLEHATPELRAVDESNWSSPDELIAADVDIYKFTHSELGYLACQRWGLPEHVSTVTRDHHTDITVRIEPGSVEATNFCVQVADRLTMYILEQPDVVNSDVRRETIETRCLVETEGEQWLLASDVDERVSNILETGRNLLSGLGFA